MISNEKTKVYIKKSTFGFGCSSYLLVDKESNLPIAVIYPDADVRYINFAGMEKPEIQKATQECIINVICESLMYDYALEPTSMFGKIYNTKKEWIESIIDELIDGVESKLFLFGPKDRNEEISTMCNSFLKKQRYYFHSDMHKRGNLCLSIWTDDGYRVPIAMFSPNGEVKYINLSEIDDDELHDQIDDLIFEHICNGVFDEMKLNSAKVDVDAVDVFIQSVIEKFTTNVVLKIIPDNDCSDLVSHYFDDCISYLYERYSY